MRLQADRPGVYSGKCAEYCGAQHANMMIVVVAHPENEFEDWRAHQLEPSSAPSTAQEARGQELFLSSPCSLCHTIRGASAGGGMRLTLHIWPAAEASPRMLLKTTKRISRHG